MIDDEAARNERHAEKMKKRKAFQDRQVASKSVEKGLLMVHTGPGKGNDSRI
jgi:cob(I)alamin adenosyltransferase